MSCYCYFTRGWVWSHFILANRDEIRSEAARRLQRKINIGENTTHLAIANRRIQWRSTLSQLSECAYEFGGWRKMSVSFFLNRFVLSFSVPQLEWRNAYTHAPILIQKWCDTLMTHNLRECRLFAFRIARRIYFHRQSELFFLFFRINYEIQFRWVYFGSGIFVFESILMTFLLSMIFWFFFVFIQRAEKKRER